MSEGSLRRSAGRVQGGVWAKSMGLLLVLPALILLGRARSAGAQDQAAEGNPQAEKMPAPVELRGSDLLTKDGMILRATFFPSPITEKEKNGKEVVPVILLHGYKGDRKQFIDLAGYLQREGHAVLVPDLRWHGESTDFRNSDIGFAPPKNAIRKDDLDAMAKIDMEKFKKFLLDKNDAGELNIEKLCILGCDMGALVALNWAYDDWSWPPVGGRKQGQYVKALVLVSPPSNFKGYNATVAFKALADQELISFQILVGKQDSKAFQEAQRMRNALDRSRPSPKESREMTPEEKIKAARARSFWFSPVDSKLQGPNLLFVRGLGAELKIAAFIRYRVADQEFPWHESKRK